MQRINTSTAETDAFGPDRPGFTDGNAGLLIPATALNSDFFNNAQEELARCVESNGDTCTPIDATEQNYFQLSNAVMGSSRVVVPGEDFGYVLSGIGFTVSPSSLNVTLGEGEYVYQGRRWAVTSAMLTAAGFDSWSLTANRDNYFFLAPSDPSTDPEYDTVHVVRSAVTNGAAAPATPSGMFLFAMLATNGSGVVSASSDYFNRGPSLLDTAGNGVRVRAPSGVSLLGSGSLYPLAPGLDLGRDACLEDTEGSYFGAIYHESRYRRRYTAPTGHIRSREIEYAPIHYTTTDGTSTDVELFELSDYPNGSMFLVDLEVCAIDTTNATPRSYTGARRFAIYITSTGALNFDSSLGASPDFAAGSLALAAGVTFTSVISGHTVYARLTGDAATTLRWVIYAKTKCVVYEP